MTDPVVDPLLLDPTAAVAPTARGPLHAFWTQFRKSHVAVLGGATLIVLYGLALLAPFVAPYAEDQMDRDRYYHPPMGLRWVDARGSFHAWPFIYATHVQDQRRFTYVEDRSVALPLRL